MAFSLGPITLFKVYVHRGFRFLRFCVVLWSCLGHGFASQAHKHMMLE